VRWGVLCEHRYLCRRTRCVRGCSAPIAPRHRAATTGAAGLPATRAWAVGTLVWMPDAPATAVSFCTFHYFLPRRHTPTALPTSGPLPRPPRPRHPFSHSLPCGTWRDHAILVHFCPRKYRFRFQPGGRSDLRHTLRATRDGIFRRAASPTYTTRPTFTGATGDTSAGAGSTW